MRAKFQLDPELAAVNVMIPRFDLDDVNASRALERLLCDQGRVATPGVVHTDYSIASSDGAAIVVRVYRREHLHHALPALLYLHGGSFVLGGLHTEEERCELYAKSAECAVVQVDYRLAPEHPFPAAYNDCLAALTWLGSEASAHGLDPRRLAVGGNSAGGALAAAVALAARAPGFPDVVLQLLVNPVLDHRSETPSALQFVDSPVWTRNDNLRMWATYLADAQSSLDERASPSLASNLRGAPSAAIWIAEFDPLRDEGYEYAIRLMRAGVGVHLQQYAETIHGFDSYRMTRLGRRALDDQVLALQLAFAR